MVSELSPCVFIIATPRDVFWLLGSVRLRNDWGSQRVYIIHIPLRANCRMHGHGCGISDIVLRRSSAVMAIHSTIAGTNRVLMLYVIIMF